MKIVADRQIPLVAQAFSGLGEVMLHEGRTITAELIADAGILLVRSVLRVNADLLAGSSVKFVASATSGTDHIDLDYLNSANIGFAAAEGSNAQAVTEYVLSSLMALAGQPGFELRDKTIGIVGCGQVGSRLRHALATLGINCLINDPPLQDSTGDPGYCDLREIMACDIISLHVPWTTTGKYPTRHLVDEKFLTGMKPDAILINTSRGGVVLERDLKQHLKQHPEFLTVLDVWEQEPQIDPDLLKLAAIATPHIAGYSADAKYRATEMIHAATCRFFGLHKTWQPEHDRFNRTKQNIHVDSGWTDVAAVAMAILTHYDVRNDAAALTRALEIEQQKAGCYFDDLRNNYPLRREFQATTITLPRERKSLAELFTGLGFTIAYH